MNTEAMQWIPPNWIIITTIMVIIGIGMLVWYYRIKKSKGEGEG